MKKKELYVLMMVLILPLSGCMSIAGSLLMPPVKVDLTHSPLVDVKKIADELNPQIINVGEFIDARKSKKIGSYTGMGGAVVKVELVKDTAAVVKEAVVDGILKAGFNIPSVADSAQNVLMNISGKILSIKVFSKSRGFMKASDTFAQVSIDFEIVDANNVKADFNIMGQFIVEKTGSEIYGAQAGENVDKAINDAVLKLLENEKFISFIKK